MSSEARILVEGQFGEIHPSIRDVLVQLVPNPNLPDELKRVSQEFYYMARGLVHNVPHNAELTVALRKLLEAKDAAVRAKLDL